MPPRSDTPHDRPLKGPRWVSPWGFDDEWEDEQRRHAIAAAHVRMPPSPSEPKAAPTEAAPPAPAKSAPASAPLVSPKSTAEPAVVSLREAPLSQPEPERGKKDENARQAAASPSAPVPAPACVSSAPIETPSKQDSDERFRPPPPAGRHEPSAPKRSSGDSAQVSAVPPAVEIPSDPPTQKRPAPVPNSVRRHKPPSLFPWSTVLTTVLGLAGLFLFGSIYLIDIPPVSDRQFVPQVPVDTAPKITGPQRLSTFLQAVNSLSNTELAAKPAWRWDPAMLQSFIQGNGAALDAMRDLLGDYDWHPHHSAWYQEDLGEHPAWPHARLLLQARVAYYARMGQEQSALDAALDLGRLCNHLQEMWAWPSYAQRAQELHVSCVQSVALVLKDTRLSAADLKASQEQFASLLPSDALLQGALGSFYLHQKKLLFGEHSGEPVDTMPGGVLQERPGRLFFKKQETLGLFASACRWLGDQAVEAPFSQNTDLRGAWQKVGDVFWLQPNSAGRRYFAEQMNSVFELPRRHHLARTRHTLVLSLFAIRRYLADHQKLPSGLSDLLPGYLTELPLDPFSGELVHYDPLKGVLFSVGDDFKAQDGLITDPPLIEAAEPTLEIGIAIATPVQASQ